MFRSTLWNASQHRAHAGEQFRKRERLHQIIVGAQLESFHPIANTIAGGKKENRRGDPIAPQFGNDIPAIFVRQHHVDDEKVKAGRARLLQAFFSITCHINGKSGFAQPFRQKCRGFVLIFDHQNPRAAHILCATNHDNEADRLCDGGTAISSPAMRNVVAAENRQ